MTIAKLHSRAKSVRESGVKVVSTSEETFGVGWREAIRLGTEADLNGDYAEALAYFKVAQMLQPDEANTALNYGVALMRTNDIDKAQVMFNLARDLTPPELVEEDETLKSNFAALKPHMDYRDQLVEMQKLGVNMGDQPPPEVGDEDPDEDLYS